MLCRLPVCFVDIEFLVVIACGMSVCRLNRLLPDQPVITDFICLCIGVHVQVSPSPLVMVVVIVTTELT